ncbi:MAG: hypothetical protein ACLFWF_08265 [Alphaproteobacteria bacterium]
MDLLNTFLQFLMDGIQLIVDLVRDIWNWSVEQIRQVPWEALGTLPLWKKIILGLAGAGVLWFLYKAGKVLFEAGQKMLDAIAALLGAFVKTLVPVLLAGVIAVVGAYIINNVHF